jgi:predicted lipoprotein
MSRFVFPIVVIALAVAATSLIPQLHLFRVVPLLEREAKKQAEGFDAATYAEDFWENRLTPALAEALDVATVLAALKDNPAAARGELGRTVGLSRATFFFVRGRGTIVAVEKSRLGVALEGDSDLPDVWITTGPVFGNALRDAPGLLQSQDFPNSQHFNELAAELNALVESRVLPPLREAAEVGAPIEFVACVEVPGGSVSQPLEMIPLSATLK